MKRPSSTTGLRARPPSMPSRTPRWSAVGEDREGAGLLVLAELGLAEEVVGEAAAGSPCRNVGLEVVDEDAAVALVGEAESGERDLAERALVGGEFFGGDHDRLEGVIEVVVLDDEGPKDGRVHGDDRLGDREPCGEGKRGVDGAYLHFALYQAKSDERTAHAQISFRVDDPRARSPQSPGCGGRARSSSSPGALGP